MKKNNINVYLSLNQVTEIVDKTVNAMFDGDYRPQYEEALIYMNYMYFTNRDILVKYSVLDNEGYLSLEKFWEIYIKNTEVKNIIENIEKSEEYKIIVSAVYDKSEYYKRKLSNPFTQVANTLSNFLIKMEEKSAKEFDDENFKTIMSALKNVSQIKNIDEDKIIKSVIEQVNKKKTKKVD